jgi:hypothetical protein
MEDIEKIKKEYEDLKDQKEVIIKRMSELYINIKKYNSENSKIATKKREILKKYNSYNIDYAVDIKEIIKYKYEFLLPYLIENPTDNEKINIVKEFIEKFEINNNHNIDDEKLIEIANMLMKYGLKGKVFIAVSKIGLNSSKWVFEDIQRKRLLGFIQRHFIKVTGVKLTIENNLSK